MKRCPSRIPHLARQCVCPLFRRQSRHSTSGERRDRLLLQSPTPRLPAQVLHQVGFGQSCECMPNLMLRRPQRQPQVARGPCAAAQTFESSNCKITDKVELGQSRAARESQLASPLSIGVEASIEESIGAIGPRVGHDARSILLEQLRMRFALCQQID